MTAPPSNREILLGLIDELHAKLCEEPHLGASAAGQRAWQAYAVNAASLPTAPPVACRRGCAYCC